MTPQVRLLGRPYGRTPAPPKRAAALLGARRPHLPCVVRGLRYFASPGRPPLPDHNFPLLDAWERHYPPAPPSCSAEVLTGLRHHPTTPAQQFVVAELLGPLQERCLLVCVHESWRFFSFFGPARLLPVSSRGPSLTLGMDYPTRSSAHLLHAAVAAEDLLLLANRLSARLKSILTYPANESFHK